MSSMKNGRVNMNNKERQHISKVVALGCIACRILGYNDTPAECHHIRTGIGKGQRASHYDTLPLCPAHHRGTAGLKVPSIHGSKNAFVQTFGTEFELLQKVRELICC